MTMMKSRLWVPSAESVVSVACTGFSRVKVSLLTYSRCFESKRL